MKKFLDKSIFIILFIQLCLPSSAQFYNGLKMTFGKNRVQYNDFYWSFYRYERFDIYFNQDGVNLANYAADFAKNEIARVEGLFDYNIDNRIIFLVYNKLTDFRQSNIGLVTGNDESNIGGITNVSKNKVFIYYEGDLIEFEQQIRGAIARVIINEMLYGSDFKDNLASSTLLNLPLWYTEGLISYISDKWNFELENKVKDGIVNERYEKFNRITGEDAIIAGHSFWRFIAETYGESVIPNIIYLTRVNKNLNSGFFYVLGLSLKNLSYEWVGYYMNLFSDDTAMDKTPDSGKILKRPKKGTVYQHIKVDPNGRYIAYSTNKMGQYKIWLYSISNRKKKVIIKREHKLEQIYDYSFPVMAWHPSGNILTFITEEKGGLRLYYYTLKTKKLEVRNLLYFDKILDFSFSHDGSRFVFSAVKNGKTDIYVHTIAAGTNFQVTNDNAGDFYPRFINNSRQIIFSSNRLNDSLKIDSGEKVGLTNDLFIFDYESNSKKLMRLYDNKFTNKSQPYETDKNTFIHLNDKSGIVNRYISKFDSTISSVDTAIHYSYIARTSPLTNYGRNIFEQDYNPKSNIAGEIFYNKGRYFMFQNPLGTEVLPAEGIHPTLYRKKRTDELMVIDSLNKIEMQKIHIQELKYNEIITDDFDTIQISNYKIDINNYVFEREKLNFYNDQLRSRNIQLELDTSLDKRPKIRVYLTSFYQNFLVNQVDFSFLSESYQAFTGGAVYFNPGMNALFKLGTNDLFENYKITGGFRLSPNFDSNEYLVSFENLKNRVDKMVVFHRQTFKNVVDNAFYVKTQSHELSYVLRYPFSQVLSWSLTLNYRNDRTVYLADYTSLEKENIYRHWGGMKFQHIYDDTRMLGINLYSGTRYKLFAEFYQQPTGTFDHLIVFGADFRKYTRIHRNLIWANRFAISTSQGTSKLIYYLGGVDNWTNITPLKNPTFIDFKETPIDTEENYAYQTVATNMRGFSQNIRNGNNFMVFNSEIRWPIIKYLVNHPISNNFLENFQIVGFGDFGTAWSGKTPWSKENAYDYTTIDRTSYTIRIDSNRSPFVGGYGFGLRSQLLGYFVRVDWAWGVDENRIRDRIFYLSLSLDF